MAGRTKALSGLAGSGQPGVILLTNNPKKWLIDDDLLAGWVEATAGGNRVEYAWSTGGTTKGIHPGDRAFLLRQGRRGRGIFASGTIVSRVYQEEHWDDSGTTANFADVQWDTVLDPSQLLPIERLLAELPGAQWEPQASGTHVNPDVVADLERMWAEHVAKVRNEARKQDRAMSDGQGRRLDARHRRQIEDLAQARLTDYYEQQGWQVQDLRYGNPFDAKATKDGEVLYLEAKGTTTSGQRVIVTRNEVAFARERPGQCVIGVVAGIRIGENEVVDPSSGELRLYAWEPEDDDLVAEDYDFYPPERLRFSSE